MGTTWRRGRAGGRASGRTDRRFSRRRFLRYAALAGAAGVLRWLTGCTAPVPAVSPAPAAEPSPGPTLGAQSAPASTPSLSPSPTPIPDAPLFDEGILTPVFVAHDPALSGYPAVPPFAPDTYYPELSYDPGALSAGNGAYRLVREALRLMSPSDFGSAEWNPLGSVIAPGDTVLIKPNLVDHARWLDGQMTHPAFLRPIVDYAYRACGPAGRILLAEGPADGDLFDRLVSDTGIRAMVDDLVARGVPVVLQDLNRAVRETTPLVDLGALSELRAVDRIWYDAHGAAMQEDGDPGIGRYRIAPWVLQADVVINVPKAKVHCSGGLTLAMKNLLGIIPSWDGPSGDRLRKDCAHTSDLDRAGGERGIYLDNDTIWRTMADLSRILLYADARGVLQPTRQRRYLAIVDGIVAAEASQYNPRPYPLNTVVVGSEPVSVDAVTARCMGCDSRRLRSVTQPGLRAGLPSLGPSDPAGVKVVVSPGGGLSARYRQAITPELYVYSWQGHLEASDFDPPRFSGWAWDPARAELGVDVSDPSGVAWVRVAYTHEGELRLRELALREGTAEAGRWCASFPLGAVVQRATLLAGDALFNEGEQEMVW